MSNDIYKAVTEHLVTHYQCGAKAGDQVRLHREFPIRDSKGEIIGKHSAGEIWTVLPGTKEEPPIIWLREPNGDPHTWSDDQAFLDHFEIIKTP